MAARNGQDIDRIPQDKVLGRRLKCMFTSVVWMALFGNSLVYGWWTIHNQIIWGVLILFSVVAGWFDVKDRRIPNLWNLIWLGGILILQIGFGSGIGAFLAVVFVGVLMLIPTLFGVWGQGDWKMSMVYGAALGVLPTLVIWWMAMVIAKGSTMLSKTSKVKWFGDIPNLGLPVATFVMIATILIYAIRCWL